MGLDIADDAAVYRLDNGDSLIFTVDFFPPVVDDPASFGRISAANAMSDVYAMGGEVVFALNLSAFPAELPAEARSAILAGGAEKVAEAGAAVAGGHTIESPEPLFGLAVVGLLGGRTPFIKGSAEQGDRLVITKPVGGGLVTTAIKGGVADEKHISAAVGSMERLNRAAAAVFAAAGVRSCTDITGFGLVGHALEMAADSGRQFVIDHSSLPLLPGAGEYADQWLFPAGTHHNFSAYSGSVTAGPAIPETLLRLMFTPETSGGLIAAVPREAAADVVAELRKKNVDAAEIGEVAAGEGILVY